MQSCSIKNDAMIWNQIGIGIVMLLQINSCVMAQTGNCNRFVLLKQDAKRIPKDICIPSNYLISNIYESTDVNGDSLPDFIFKWRKPELQDGDTFYVTIYIQNPDSTFTNFRTFNNLYPIYFKDYSRDYISPNSALAALQKKYEGEDPFVELKFEGKLITLKIKYATKEDLWIQYSYDKSKKDWLYQKAEIHNYWEKITPMDLSDKIGPSIKNFTYFFWDEE